MHKKPLSGQELEQIVDRFSQRAASPSGAFSVDDSYVKFKQRLPEQKQPRRMPLYIRYIATVAAVFLAAVCGYGIYNLTAQPQQFTLTTTDRIEHITLPDGSTVTLGRHSSLTYFAKQKGNERNVFLTGEAYFDVVRDEARIFIVHLKELDVSVLGTQFNVQAYPQNNQVRTTLLEGAVAISLKNGNDNIVLAPRESGVYHKHASILLKEDAPYAEDEISWMNGMLIFHEAALEDIIQRLNNCYETNVRIADSQLKGYKISATFDDSQTLNEILDLLQQVGGFHHDNGVIYADAD